MQGRDLVEEVVVADCQCDLPEGDSVHAGFFGHQVELAQVTQQQAGFGAPAEQFGGFVAQSGQPTASSSPPSTGEQGPAGGA